MSKTRYVPCCLASAIPASSMRLECSTESIPARIASLIDCVPCACAATLRPSLCFLCDRFQFIERLLWRAGLVALRHHAAGSTDLDEIRSIFHHLAYLGSRRPRPIGDTFVTMMELGRKQILIAMPASDAQRWTRNQHTRAFHIACI